MDVFNQEASPHWRRMRSVDSYIMFPIIAFVLITLWLGLLFSTIGIAASDFFCINLSTIASILGMSESMAGVTFLAFGNGSPDVFSTYAAMSTHSGSLAIGELIGAAGFITAVVAGSMALVRPFRVARKSFVRDVGFFIFAASFSLVFLYDGKLSLWECAAMVGFYIFYVVFVVLWHWWYGRRRRRREIEAAARGHFAVPETETEAQAPYHDDPEDTPRAMPRISREPSASDFSTLERGGSIRTLELDDDEEEETGRLMGELSSNMRLRRPYTGMRSRSSTLNPIRPSLVGALEFRSVLDSLQKSRNIQTLPINLRRYSDDPHLVLNQQSDQLSTVSDPAAAESHPVSRQPSRSLGILEEHGRVRAASAAAAVNLSRESNPEAVPKLDSVPEIDLLGASPEPDSEFRTPSIPTVIGSQSSLPPIDWTRSPSVSISPSPSGPRPSDYLSSNPQHPRQLSPNHLCPEDAENLNSRIFIQSPAERLQVEHDSPRDSPKSLRPTSLPRLDVPSSQTHSRNTSGASSPISPFPTFTDAPRSQSPVGIPAFEYPTSASEDAHYPGGLFEDARPETRLKWWPYYFFPSPDTLWSTLFPTLYGWRDKTLWEKSLGLVAAPSVFLLTITLPVVEPVKDDDHDSTLEVANDDGAASTNRRATRASQTNLLVPEGPPAEQHFAQSPSPSMHHKSFGGHGDTATVAVEVEARHQRHSHGVSPALSRQSTDPKPGSHSSQRLPQTRLSEPLLPSNLPSPAAPPSSKCDWNRWLIILQCFNAPFFIVFILWANGVFTSASPSNPDPPPSARDLLRPVLIALLCSLVSLILLLFTTTSTDPPKWRPLLCFVGFAVSIAWISTVAGEVVGVLKTLGVVLNISDAILGLTIFAVGNSLGDLVADITVARLGYPVMALSACFGGPMLNILLGIGISGLSMMVRAADKRHHRHPQKEFKYKPYEIEVGSTLLISGVVLLLTLVGLLIIVPINKWRMDRKVGWGLIVLWVLGTVGNLIMELTGFEMGLGSGEEAL
ncbi:MAG: hypothetical protein M1821_000951 [Bathelium mastoideum]|nr:MAG: hypothetical protein M1821_000951 [Bathelium mastoideum]